MKQKFPKKSSTNVLKDEIAYCEKLIDVIEKKGLSSYPKIKEPLNLLKETAADDYYLNASVDKDAKVGHKSADFTSGEKPDGRQLPYLVEKSRDAGMEVNTVIGDMAYSEKENIRYSKENSLKLVSKLNPLITQGSRKKEDKFEFNKDAGMYVCKAGHMAIKKYHNVRKIKGENPVDIYLFDTEKCKRCPFKEGCYKEGAKKKTYSVTIKSNEHSEQAVFQETTYFKEKAKHGELKNRHGYDVASYSCLSGMELQGATSIFIVNIKRILKLIG